MNMTTRCVPCVEKALRRMVRERDAKINALEAANKQLNKELGDYKRSLADYTGMANEQTP